MKAQPRLHPVRCHLRRGQSPRSNRNLHLKLPHKQHRGLLNLPRKRQPPLRVSKRPRAVLLTAAWCQWCQVLKHEVLPKPSVKKILERRFDFLIADVDEGPLWMDLEGVRGLPSFVFFDRQGRYLLARSGFRESDSLRLMLEAIADSIQDGRISASKPRTQPIKLSSEPITPKEAKDALKSYEFQIFIKINSNSGGFGTPARHPYPDLLRELAAWTRAFNSPGTCQGSSRAHSDGCSPRREPKTEGKASGGHEF